MAFADDLVLLSQDDGGLQSLMDITTDHLHKIGLNLSVGKTGVFGVKRKGKSWITTEMNITSGEEILKNV